MTGIIRLIFQVAASFAGGYLANDVVDIFQSNQAQRKAGTAPTGMFTDALRRWQDQNFIMKFLFVIGLAVVVAVVFMTRVQRKKLFK